MGFEATNKRGTLEHYGPRETEMKYGGRVSWDNLKKTAVWTFDYDNLPDNGAANLDQVIPANSTILSAKMRIVTAFTSTSTTTDLTVGLRTAGASTEDIDDNGLITAAQATQTTIAVVGSIIDGSSGTAGALIGKTIGSSAGELYVAPSVDDLLTGRAEVIVEYLVPSPTAA